MVPLLLRLEGLVFFILALVLYHVQSGNWLLFLLLLFTPDVSMLGYLRNNRLGARGYNLFHNYIAGIVVAVLGIVCSTHLVLLLGIIIFAHVAMDRMLGFGLKYPSAFKDTHLQRV